MSAATEEVIELRIGDEVQIETTDGEKLSGEVIRVSENELAISRASNYGFEERTVLRDQIVDIKVREDSTVGSIGLTALGVVLATFVVLMVINGPK